jgi:PIN domain nuclease of toxin-antitoxin system
MGYAARLTVHVLLDTCCLIWAVSNVDQLTDRVAGILRAPTTHVFVSAISCAEIACLAERGHIVIDRHWKLWFDAAVGDNEWGVLSINLDVIQEAYSLPGRFHRDPADRIITGTARLRDLTVLTADAKLLNYPHVQTVWT